MKSKMRIQRGFTLVELAVVTSIIVTLLGIITINLVRSQQNASLTSVQEVLIADLRQQQLKSMIGDTEGRADSSSYGIHFDSNQYVFFYGTYSASAETNYATSLPDNLQFNNPEFNVIFSKITGEIPSATVIEIQDNTNLQVRRIHLNTLGNIVQVESL